MVHKHYEMFGCIKHLNVTCFILQNNARKNIIIFNIYTICLFIKLFAIIYNVILIDLVHSKSFRKVSLRVLIIVKYQTKTK